MPLLHEQSVRTAIVARVRALTPKAPRQWGKMTVDQMLWHVNEAMEQALGRGRAEPAGLPLPKTFLRFMLLKGPWGKGAPTNPAFVASGQHDFEAERARCLALIDELTARDLGGTWPDSAFAGPMRGHHWSQLHARHLDHHLKQFGS